jgi:uncharacterized protein (TIGR03086 family)
MEMLDALSQTFDHATKIVSGVSNDELDSPTPCSEWPLRTLLAHMTAVVVNMGRGAGGSELLPSIEGFVIEPDDLGTQFRTEADRTLAAWRTRGDDDEVNVGAGPMPARVALAINLLDTATHSWDVARCTGQDANLPDAVASAALACAHQIVSDEIRGFAGFAPAISTGPDASPTDQLVAFLGRKP